MGEDREAVSGGLYGCLKGRAGRSFHHGFSDHPAVVSCGEINMDIEVIRALEREARCAWLMRLRRAWRQRCWSDGYRWRAASLPLSIRPQRL